MHFESNSEFADLYQKLMEQAIFILVDLETDLV